MALREDQGTGCCGPQATHPSDLLFHFSRMSIDLRRCPPLAGEGYEVLLSLQEGSSLMESASGTVLSREIGLDGRRSSLERAALHLGLTSISELPVVPWGYPEIPSERQLRGEFGVSTQEELPCFCLHMVCWPPTFCSSGPGGEKKQNSRWG